MTSKEVIMLRKYHADGLGYRKIAKLLGMSENTVKTYILRHGKELEELGCLSCGCKLVQRPHTKQKKFCSDACRMLWWACSRGFVLKI